VPNDGHGDLTMHHSPSLMFHITSCQASIAPVLLWQQLHGSPFKAPVGRCGLLPGWPSMEQTQYYCHSFVIGLALAADLTMLAVNPNISWDQGRRNT